MANKSKIVHDPIHGSITIAPPFLDILDRHEMQRIRSVKQLGLGDLVFPGANHTRFEHCLGVYHLSGRMGKVLDLDDEDITALMAAGLLHDVCHAPFSHTLEESMESITGRNHMDLARDLILGRIPTFMERDRDILDGIDSISEILEDGGISADMVCDLIAYPKSTLGPFHIGDEMPYFSSRDYMHQVIHGPVDSDQMDYLLRDAHYTGVNLGTIDMERLLSQMVKYNDQLVLKRGGIVAAEGLVVSRLLMHSSVYFHKTIRTAEMMLVKAVDEAMDQGCDMSEMYLMTDSDLIQRLMSFGGKASDITRNIMLRRLYKKAYILYFSSLSDDDVIELARYASDPDARKELEGRIAARAGVDVSDVIVDMPPRSALLSEQKIGKTDVNILDGGRIRTLSSFSTLARSLQSRSNFDWALMVSAPAGMEGAVAKAARNIIGIEDVTL